MHYTLISDLHLGAGDSLEDFLWWGNCGTKGPAEEERRHAIDRLNRQFHHFLMQRLEEAYTAGLEPHLILAGDIFDLWQVRRPRENPGSALLRILEAHLPVVTALRLWIGAGGHLTYVLGNHDQPLVESRAWALVREILPTINRHADGQPVHHFTDESAGLYVEHGHQWDPFNRITNLRKWNSSCAGYRIVAHVVNRLEPLLPLLDKGASFLDLLELLWERGEGEGIVPWQEVTAHLARLIGCGAGPARVLSRQLQNYRREPARAPDFQYVALQARRIQTAAIRRALDRRGATIGTPPMNFRFLAAGHTHLASMEQLHTRKAAVTYLNPGTWRPLVHRSEDGQLLVRQQLNYIALHPREGEWRAELGEWKLGNAE